jgi:hypothetical protein
VHGEEFRSGRELFVPQPGFRKNPLAFAIDRANVTSGEIRVPGAPQANVLAAIAAERENATGLLAVSHVFRATVVRHVERMATVIVAVRRIGIAIECARPIAVGALAFFFFHLLPPLGL